MFRVYLVLICIIINRVRISLSVLIESLKNKCMNICRLRNVVSFMCTPLQDPITVSTVHRPSKKKLTLLPKIKFRLNLLKMNFWPELIY